MSISIEYICFICIMIPLIMMTITMTGKSRLLIGSMTLGVFVSLFCSEISGAIVRSTGLSNMYYITTTVTPLVEETLKALPVLMYAFMISDKRETLLSIAFGIGVGFAVLENIVILLRAVMDAPETVSYLWAFVRGFGSGLMHAVTTMMIGIGINLVKKNAKLIIPGIFAMFVMASIYHGIYNSLVQTDLKYWGFVLPLCTYLTIVPLTFKGRVGNKKRVEAS